MIFIIMERITFDQLPEMVALILEKLERIEMLIGSGDTTEHHLGKEMLTLDETASFMGVSRSTLYKMSHNRDLPVYKPTGGRLYFKKDDLIKYMQSNRVMSKQEIEREAINYLATQSSKRRALRSPKK